jgi:hypothetical protein
MDDAPFCFWHQSFFAALSWFAISIAYPEQVMLNLSSPTESLHA